MDLPQLPLQELQGERENAVSATGSSLHVAIPCEDYFDQPVDVDEFADPNGRDDRNEQEVREQSKEVQGELESALPPEEASINGEIARPGCPNHQADAHGVPNSKSRVDRDSEKKNMWTVLVATSFVIIAIVILGAVLAATMTNAGTEVNPVLSATVTTTIGMTTFTYTATISIKSQSELKNAVDECIKISPSGGCGRHQHGPIES